MTGVQLLTTDSEPEAMRLAEQLEQLNRQRQQHRSGDHASEAARLVWRIETGRRRIVLASRRLASGRRGDCGGPVGGTVSPPEHCDCDRSSRDREGSARTVQGFDLYQGLISCRDLLDAFGGHPSAAGLTIKESRLHEFRDDSARSLLEWASGHAHVPTLHVDAEVQSARSQFRLDSRNRNPCIPLERGIRNPPLPSDGLDVVDARVVGEKHLKMRVRQGRSCTFDSIGFRMGSLEDLGLRVRSSRSIWPLALNAITGMDTIGSNCAFSALRMSR